MGIQHNILDTIYKLIFYKFKKGKEEMEKFNLIQQKLEEMKTDIEKFYTKEQNAAGSRLRKQLNEIRKVAAEIRKDIQNIKAERKSKGK
ncbi:MAG: hypothetical protein FJ216_09305 [Ignavibacteria bacterium]|nr:hypothetical protein [Ignavibacteria bacterium]